MVRIVFGIVITFTIILSVSGCQKTNQVDATPASDMTPTGNVQEAALLAQIEQKYESPAAHYQLGRIYHAEGLYDKAEFEYRVALGFDPASDLARAGIVKVLADQGKSAAAADAAQQYITRETDSPEAALRMGRAFESFGLNQYALQCYQQAQLLSPDSADVYRRLGYYYLAQGDKIQAEQHFRQSFRLNSSQPEVAAELGRMGIPVETPQQPEKQNLLQKLFKKDKMEETPEEPKE